MTVKYDREKCQVWLERAKGLLSEKELAQLWVNIAFEEEAPTLNVHGDKQLVMQWAEMSLWERQEVLYLFAPVMKDLAAVQARRCAKKARRWEPL